MPDPMDQRGSWDLVCLQRTLVALISQQDRRLPPRTEEWVTEHRGIFTSLCPRPIYTLQHRTLGAAEAHDARKHPLGFWALWGTVRELQSPIPTNSFNAPTRVTSPRHRARQCCRLCESILITNLIPTQPVWD